MLWWVGLLHSYRWDSWASSSPFHSSKNFHCITFSCTLHPHYCIFSLLCLSLHRCSSVVLSPFIYTPCPASQFPHWAVSLLALLHPTMTCPWQDVPHTACQPSPCPHTGWDRHTCTEPLLFQLHSCLVHAGQQYAREQQTHQDIPGPSLSLCTSQFLMDPDHFRRSRWSDLSPGRGDFIWVGTWACSPGHSGRGGGFLLQQKLSSSVFPPASQDSLAGVVCFILWPSGRGR